jgi:hypothetical protein
MTEIVYFPEIKSLSSYEDIVLRASWYLTFSDIKKIKLFVKPGLSLPEKLNIPPHFDPKVKDRIRLMFDIAEIQELTSEKSLIESVKTADIVLRFDESVPTPETQAIRFDVDPKRTRKEGSNYIEVSHVLLQNKKSVVSQEHQRFLHLIKDIPESARSYVFGTGPSAGRYDEFDYRDAISVVCNSIIIDQKLMNTVNPKVLVFGDPIFHFGPSVYAAEFRKAAIEAVKKYNLIVVSTLKNHAILHSYFSEISDRVVCVPFQTKMEFNFDLKDLFKVKTTGNILTLLMIPVASSLAKIVNIVGCDGRDFDDNNYFWNHNKKTQFNERMSDIQKCHPSFFAVDYDSYYFTHCSVLENMLDAGEKSALTFYSSTFSYIPALARRANFEQKEISSNIKGDIIIIDPDSVSEEDHFIAQTRNIESACFCMGYRAYVVCRSDLIYTSKRLPQYWHPSITASGIKLGKGDADKEAIKEFYQQLRSYISGHNGMNSTHIILTCGSAHYLENILSLSIEYSAYNFTINLYWDMWHSVRTQQWADLLNKTLPECAQQKNLSVTVQSESLSERIRNLTGYELPVISQPSMLFDDIKAHADHLPRLNTRKKSGEVFSRVFFPGSARPGKGYEVNIRVAQLLAGSDIDVTLRRRDIKIRREEKILTNYDLSANNIEWVDGELDESELSNHFFKSDIAILVYDPSEFKMRTSGLAVEALCHGVPIVTNPGTWIADLVARTKSGIVASSSSAEDIHASIQALYQRYGYFSTNATLAGTTIIGRGAWTKLVKEILLSRPPVRTEAGNHESHNAPNKIRKILLIGNGPSTRQLVDYGLENIPDDIDTIGMTAAYRYFESVSWWPTYYALADSKVVLFHKDHFKRLIEDDSIPVRKFFLSYAVTDHPRMELIPHSPTGPFCFKKALDLGYDEIYLIGIEGKYVEEIAESKPLTEQEFYNHGFDKLNLEPARRNLLKIIKTPKRNPNYFFDTYQIKGDVYSLPNSKSHVDVWARVAKKAEQSGVRVYNLSLDSVIEHFPKLSLQKAFAQTSEPMRADSSPALVATRPNKPVQNERLMQTTSFTPPQPPLTRPWYAPMGDALRSIVPGLYPTLQEARRALWRLAGYPLAWMSGLGALGVLSWAAIAPGPFGGRMVVAGAALGVLAVGGLGAIAWRLRRAIQTLSAENRRLAEDIAFIHELASGREGRVDRILEEQSALRQGVGLIRTAQGREGAALRSELVTLKAAHSQDAAALKQEMSGLKSAQARDVSTLQSTLSRAIEDARAGTQASLQAELKRLEAETQQVVDRLKAEIVSSGQAARTDSEAVLRSELLRLKADQAETSKALREEIVRNGQEVRDSVDATLLAELSRLETVLAERASTEAAALREALSQLQADLDQKIKARAASTGASFGRAAQAALRRETALKEQIASLQAALSRIEDETAAAQTAAAQGDAALREALEQRVAADVEAGKAEALAHAEQRLAAGLEALEQRLTSVTGDNADALRQDISALQAALKGAHDTAAAAQTAAAQGDAALRDELQAVRQGLEQRLRAEIDEAMAQSVGELAERIEASARGAADDDAQLREDMAALREALEQRVAADVEAGKAEALANAEQRLAAELEALERRLASATGDSADALRQDINALQAALKGAADTAAAAQTAAAQGDAALREELQAVRQGLEQRLRAEIDEATRESVGVLSERLEAAARTAGEADASLREDIQSLRTLVDADLKTPLEALQTASKQALEAASGVQKATGALRKNETLLTERMKAAERQIGALKYPDAPDVFVFFGHHKCGSRFFRNQVFGRIAESTGARVRSYKIANPPHHYSRLDDLDLPNIDFSGLGEHGRDVVLFANATQRSLDKIRRTAGDWRGLRIIRDPRQVLVSNYFHHKGDHHTEINGWVWDQLKHDKPILNELSKEDGILHELDNISRHVIEDLVLASFDDERVLTLRLEDFSADPKAHLERIASFLKVPDVAGIDLGATQANPDSGPWPQHFTSKIREVFKARYGQALIDLGYEEDMDW